MMIPTILAALCVLCVLCVVILVVLLRPADPRMVLAIDQVLAGQRSAADTQRLLLSGAERALGERVDGSRAAVEQRLGELTTSLAREQGEQRVLLEAKLREMADASARRLAEIQRSVNEQLSEAVEKQMSASFQRVIDQFAAVQKAMGDVAAVTAQIGDLRRVFGNIKTRGGWGETHLRALLDDLLPPGAYETNVRLREGSAETVEFAVRMPARGEARPLLAMDAKFPTSDYERLLDATAAGDAEGERAARRSLEARLRLEARKIGEKYVCPPRTLDFALMYLPSEGLYAEAVRVPGLTDELARGHRVLVTGPSVAPALLRTVQLGYMTVQLEQSAERIGRLLAGTKEEMVKMDGVLERLARNVGTMGNTIEDARRRTRAVARQLRDLRVEGETGLPGLEARGPEARGPEVDELEEGALEEGA